jgi:hypothetical protein
MDFRYRNKGFRGFDVRFFAARVWACKMNEFSTK